MAAQRKGLGKGLEMLINSNPPVAETTVQEDEKEKEIEIDIRKIEPNRNQPRKQFDEDSIDELADSIKQYGVIQPLIVQKKDKYYEIIAGERRWRACKKAGLKKVPVIVRDYDEQERLKISLIENIQRENLNAIEEAIAYKNLQDQYGLRQEEIAESLSKSRASITNTLRLLKLDDKVQKMIVENLISSGHGRALLAVEDKEEQYKMAVTIMDNNLSVRETEKMIKQYLEKKNKPSDDDKNKSENEQEEQMIRYYESRMKEILGSKVEIKNKKNNKGKVQIDYYSREELERIIELIQTIKL